MNIKQYQADVLFIVGSGGVPNSWTPVREALEEIYDPSGLNKGKESLEDIENFVMANLIFQLRFLKKFPEGRTSNLLNARLDLFARLKEKIAEKLRSPFLQVHEELSKIENEHFTGVVAVATTNWDLVLDSRYCSSTMDWKTFPKVSSLGKVVHLHGSIENPESIFLPSEEVEEPYRSANCTKELKAWGSHFMNLVSHSKKIVILGLGFNDLDAELGIWFSEGLNERKTQGRPYPKIHIYDRCPKKVEKRIKFFSDELAIDVHPI